MEYLAQVAAFLIAAFGITGDTWDHKKSGILKFTPIGWLIGILAVVTLVVSLSIVYRADSAKRVAEEQRVAVQSIAQMQVCLAALRYKFVLDVITHHATGIEAADGSDIGLSFDDLKSIDTISKLADFNLLQPREARPNVGDVRPLSIFISEEISEFVDLTNLALAKYTTFLDKELILQATQLSSHNITRRFVATSEQIEQMTNNGQNEYPGLSVHEKNSYPFIVDLLEKLLARTGMRKEIMACEPPEFFKNA